MRRWPQDLFRTVSAVCGNERRKSIRRIRQNGTVEHLLYGDLVQHFKREKLSEEKKEDTYLYRILCVATDTETGKKCVIYQAMYGNFGVYSRPMDMFLSEVDHNKYPDIKQEYRFEKVVYNENEWKKTQLELEKNSIGFRCENRS